MLPLKKEILTEDFLKAVQNGLALGDQQFLTKGMIPNLYNVGSIVQKKIPAERYLNTLSHFVEH